MELGRTRPVRTDKTFVGLRPLAPLLPRCDEFDLFMRYYPGSNAALRKTIDFT